MKQTFEKELHMKTAEFEGCIAEIQNEKDKYRAELDYMREGDKVTNKQQEKAIETERHDYKMSIQDLRERYENEIAKRRTEFWLCALVHLEHMLSHFLYRGQTSSKDLLSWSLFFL
jgi:Skp family chaperone for outer membrane proteins